MTPYAVKNGDILPEELAVLRMVQDIFRALTDKDYEVSCHHLCHAMGSIFSFLQVEDGYFGPGHEHSWLVLKDKSPDGKIILDVYPVAGTAPFMIYAHWNVPWRSLYRQDLGVVQKFRDRDPDFDFRVADLVAEIKQFLHTIVCCSPILDRERVMLDC